MIFFVIVINLLITLINIYLAVKLLQLRRLLRKTTNILLHCEQKIQILLSSTPEIILQGQRNLDHLQQRYQLLQMQLQKIRKILAILSLIYRVSGYKPLVR
ncbi:MAG: hypothetical protein AB4368_29830 [Xenococcaceae cyanobacterium]